ncbi:MAG TPA: DNA polymerase III subunit chi [Bauldia sp.]|nr:DNA polymerase III subunit chi [Bauldia sp.]
MAEVLFYHLQSQPLEQVLPGLLERSLERKWRVIVQVGSEERRDALDAHLWTYRDESFLPHGTAKETRAAEQPVWLTATDDNPNGATVRFLADGAETADYAAYQRVVILFDGNDPDAVGRARGQWATAKAAGHDATYWQQAQSGRWEKKA